MNSKPIGDVLMMKKITRSFFLIILVSFGFGFISIAHAQDVMLYKNPQCGCCEGYADYLRDNGFNVTVQSTHELSAMSRDAGIPDNFQGCHLSTIGDYFVSGHVPVSSVNKLLTEKPDIEGISLPGMPQGSPGMSGTKSEPFTTYAITNGETEIYTVE